MGLLDKLLSRKPNYDEFAREFIRSLAAAGAHNIRHNPVDHSIRIGSGEATFYLDNALRDYLAAPPAERGGVIARYISSFTGRTDIPSDYSSCKGELLPVVRDPAYFGLSYLTLKARGSDVSKLQFVSREITRGLCAGIAYDTPANIATVGATQLETWQVGFDDAFEQACLNLREKTDTARFKQLAPGLYVGDWHDCYDASRMLLPEIFHRLQLNGDPVVFLPNRDLLFVTGSYDSAAQALILKHSFQAHFEQGHSLSSSFYTHSGGKWSPFLPGEGGVAAQARAFQYRRDALDYDQQKKLLEEIYKKEETDIFVASCQLLKRKDESLFTRCVWTRGVDSLLPETENLVLLVDVKTKEMLELPWEKAFPVLSPLLEKVPELVPVRYRARTFPSDELLQKVRGLVLN